MENLSERQEKRKAQSAAFGQFIKNQRQRRGWSQGDLAERLGGAADDRMVRRWEAGGARPSSHYAQKLAALFGVTVAQLGLAEELTTEATIDITFDVCIICALAEEARAFISAATDYFGAQFAQGFSHRNYEYRYTTIQNSRGKLLTLHISWLPRFGPLETALHLSSVLSEFKPRFTAMTGICAGDKRRVRLGDIIVADRIFSYDTGKINTNDERKDYSSAIDTQSIEKSILQIVRMFDGWKSIVSKIPRPISLRQQRDWLLNELLEEKTPRVDDIAKHQLDLYAPDWRKIVRVLQSGPQPYLTKDRALADKSRIHELRYGLEEFPFRDTIEPISHIAPMASSNAIHNDNPFDELRTIVPLTIAIDMEGSAFYRTAMDFPSTRFLLVKGVCDYADADKDNTYHSYSATVSAMYVLSLIKEYVTDQLMPKPQPKALRVVPSEDGQGSPRHTPLHALLLYTPEDQEIENYISEHWTTVDALSDGFCDIYSVSNQSGIAASQINCRLPGLLFWDNYHKSVYVPFGPKFDSTVIKHILGVVFEEIRREPTIATIIKAKDKILTDALQ